MLFSHFGFMRLNSYKRALAFLGNFFEHYDTALFGLMLPFLSEKFFPGEYPLQSLIKGFILLPLTVLSKPVGAWFFSFLSFKKSQNFPLKQPILECH